MGHRHPPRKLVADARIRTHTNCAALSSPTQARSPPNAELANHPARIRFGERLPAPPHLVAGRQTRRHLGSACSMPNNDRSLGQARLAATSACGEGAH